jgi:hypothetical protein
MNFGPLLYAVLKSKAQGVPYTRYVPMLLEADVLRISTSSPRTR